MIFHVMWHKFFYKFASKDLGLLNIKSFKSKQYSSHAKIFGFHECLIAEILNIFYIISYARMIMALLEQLIGSTKPILIIVFCNDLLEKNNLSRKIACVVALLDLVRAFHHQLDGLFCYSWY